MELYLDLDLDDEKTDLTIEFCTRFNANDIVSPVLDIAIYQLIVLVVVDTLHHHCGRSCCRPQ